MWSWRRGGEGGGANCLLERVGHPPPPRPIAFFPPSVQRENMQTQQCRGLCQSPPPALPPFKEKMFLHFQTRDSRCAPTSHPVSIPEGDSRGDREVERERSPLLLLPCCSLDIMGRVFPSLKEQIYGAEPSCWALPKMDRC